MCIFYVYASKNGAKSKFVHQNIIFRPASLMVWPHWGHRARCGRLYTRGCTCHLPPGHHHHYHHHHHHQYHHHHHYRQHHHHIKNILEAAPFATRSFPGIQISKYLCRLPTCFNPNLSLFWHCKIEKRKMDSRVSSKKLSFLTMRWQLIKREAL